MSANAGRGLLLPAQSIQCTGLAGPVLPSCSSGSGPTSSRAISGNHVIVQKPFMKLLPYMGEIIVDIQNKEEQAKTCYHPQCFKGAFFFLDKFVSNQVEKARPILFESRNKEKMRYCFARSRSFGGIKQVELLAEASTTVLHPIC
jgi:hypothetical protein